MLLAYEMNGEPLPPDHGFPVRLVVPDWIGISSIKWVGDIEVSAEPLFSPVEHPVLPAVRPRPPSRGRAVNRQVVKSAFELDWNAHASRRPAYRSAGAGPGPATAARIVRVDVSTDGGGSWQRARLSPCRVPARPGSAGTIDWRPEEPGTHELLARATDSRGVTQPDVSPYNTLGYLFGAVVRHPVTVS